MLKRNMVAFSGWMLVVILGVWGCSKEPAESIPRDSSAIATSHAGTSASVTLSAEVAAKLAKADALDGATDHVVSKCGMCALRMPGSETHTTALGEYALHFCSDDCKRSFDEDATKAVLAFKVG